MPPTLSCPPPPSLPPPQAEEVARALEEQLGQARARTAQLEGAVRSRDKDLVAVTKQLDAARGGELSVEGKKLQVGGEGGGGSKAAGAER